MDSPAGLEWTWAYFFDVLNFMFLLLALLLVQQLMKSGRSEAPGRGKPGFVPFMERSILPVTPWAGGLLLFLFDASIKILVWDTFPGQHLFDWGQSQREQFPGLPMMSELVAMSIIIYGLLRYLRAEEPGFLVEEKDKTHQIIAPNNAKAFYAVNMSLAAMTLACLIFSILFNLNWGRFIIQPGILGLWELAIVGYAIKQVWSSKTWIRNSMLVMLSSWALAALFGLVIPTTGGHFQQVVQYLNISAVRNAFLLISFITLIRLIYRAVFYRLHQVSETRDRLSEEKDVIFSFLSRLAGGLESRKTLAESLDVGSVLKEILSFAVDTTKASAGAIYLIEEGKEGEPSYLAAKVVHGYFAPAQNIRMDRIVVKQKMVHDLVLSERLSLGEGLIGQAAESGRSELIRDADTDFRVHQPSIDFLRIKTMVIVPLKDQNTIAGVLVVTNKQAPEGVIPFDETDESLLWSIADLAAITINNAKMHHDLADKERLEREIQIARDVQQLLLPSRCPEIDGYEIQGYNQPAWRVGGDYYDFIWLDDHRLLIVIADVAGKGVSGALTMGMVRTMLRAEAPRSQGIRDLIRKTNEFVYRDTKSDMFVSMMLAELDIENRKMTVVRAGHEPLIVFGPAREEYHLHSPEGIALGLDDGQLFNAILEERTLDLHDGDVLVFYTDGITEAMNAEHEEYTLERFIETIKVSKGLDSPEIVEAVNQSISTFTGEIPQHDDLTLVLIKVKSRMKPAARSPKVEMLPQRQEDRNVEKVRSLHNAHTAR